MESPNVRGNEPTQALAIEGRPVVRHLAESAGLPITTRDRAPSAWPRAWRRSLAVRASSSGDASAGAGRRRIRIGERSGDHEVRNASIERDEIDPRVAAARRLGGRLPWNGEPERGQSVAVDLDERRLHRDPDERGAVQLCGDESANARAFYPFAQAQNGGESEPHSRVRDPVLSCRRGRRSRASARRSSGEGAIRSRRAFRRIRDRIESGFVLRARP